MARASDWLWPDSTGKPMVIVAKCLAGVPCRYHGEAAPPRRALLARLDARYEVLLFCPEEEAGLPTPRPPARWRDGRLIAAGKDVTEFFQRGAELTLQLAKAHRVKKFYGLRLSPSCDPETGITARLLRRHRIRCLYG